MTATVKRWMLLPILAVCVVPALAFADPIRITSGGLVGDRRNVDVTLASKTRGFSLVGSGEKFGGVWSPGNCDGSDACLPGSAQSLTGLWIGSDFGATATLDDHTFSFGLLTESTGEAAVDFEGSWIAPPFTANRTKATVVRPFTFEGSLTFPIVPGSDEPRLGLVGSGKATLRLSRSTGAEGWELVSATYRFDHSAVPEPASILLVGTGLGLIGRRVLRCQRKPELMTRP
jgi:PEP-CTERM motif-containing protein